MGTMHEFCTWWAGGERERERCLIMHENDLPCLSDVWMYLSSCPLYLKFLMRDRLCTLIITVWVRDLCWIMSSCHWLHFFLLSCGGNLLLNVGPTKEGTIAPIFEERLRQMGQWLTVNGEAIYGTRPWLFQNDTLQSDVWYVQLLIFCSYFWKWCFKLCFHMRMIQLSWFVLSLVLPNTWQKIVSQVVYTWILKIMSTKSKW